MQEFCPLCSKNGVKTKIKAYQLNFHEAVFMCSGKNCTWPAGYEEPKFINRSVGSEWSCTWEQSAAKNIKSENDLLIEFSVYTPPQTPSNEFVCKDSANSQTSCPATVIPEVTTASTLIDKIIHKDQEIPTNIRVAHDSCKVSSISSVSVKPKLVESKPVNYTFEKLPEKSYIFLKNNENSDRLLKKNPQLKVVTNNASNKFPTSLVGKSRNNVEKLCVNVSKVSADTEKPKEGLRTWSGKKAKTRPYQKFTFSELLKKKSTNQSKECKPEDKEEKPGVQVLNDENKVCLPDKPDTNQLSVVSKCTNVVNESTDLDLIFNIGNTNPKVVDTPKKFKRKPGNDLVMVSDLTQVVDSNAACSGILVAASDSTNIVDSSNNDEFDFDSLLGLTSSSKDSGVDQDMLENGDLDELLGNFSQDLSQGIDSTCNRNRDDSEEYRWINSLFE